MKVKKLSLVLAAGVTVFSLAACGKPVKETVISSTESLYNAKQMESDSSVKFTLTSTSKEFNTQNKDNIDMLKGLSLNVHSMSDKDAKKEQADIKAELKADGASVAFELPLYMNSKTQKVYTKLDNLGSLLSMAGMEADALSSVKGKVVDLTSGAAQTADLASVTDNEKLQKVSNKVFLDLLNKLPEEQFAKDKEDKNKVSVTLKQKDVNSLINTYMDEAAKIKDSGITKDQVKQVKDGLKAMNMKDSKIVITYTLKDDVVKNQHVDLKFTIKNQDNEKEYITLGIVVDTKVKSLNKKVKFDFNVQKNKVVTTEEVMGLFIPQAEDATSTVETGIYDAKTDETSTDDTTLETTP
ncbi:hypothetical protein CN918_26240 [Priestia megaterium]|nr:hypothetical protein CN918_26240 [Priestia megaterium]